MSGEVAIYRPALNRDKLVHIVDENLRTCETLSTLFRLEGFQAQFSSDVSHFWINTDWDKSARARSPDIVIVNLNMKEHSGCELVRQLKGLRPSPIVMGLCDKPDTYEIVKAMRYGAHSVHPVPVVTERMLIEVRKALYGSRQSLAIGSRSRMVDSRNLNKLTPRERDILELIVNGCSNKEAGNTLGISARTVEVHRARIMDKLGARNAADLVRIVMT